MSTRSIHTQCSRYTFDLEEGDTIGNPGLFFKTTPVQASLLLTIGVLFYDSQGTLQALYVQGTLDRRVVVIIIIIIIVVVVVSNVKTIGGEIQCILEP